MFRYLLQVFEGILKHKRHIFCIDWAIEFVWQPLNILTMNISLLDRLFSLHNELILLSVSYSRTRTNSFSPATMAFSSFILFPHVTYPRSSEVGKNAKLSISTFAFLLRTLYWECFVQFDISVLSPFLLEYKKL